MSKDQMTTKDMDACVLSDTELDAVNGGVIWLIPVAFALGLLFGKCS